MSKVKISDLAKEFGMTWKQLAEEIHNLTGETVKSPSTKIDEEVVSLLRDVLGESTVLVEEEQEEKKEEKKGIKLWDLAHEIDVPIEDIKEGLKALGFEGEIDSFTVVEESIVEKIKEYLKEKEKREEEKKKEEEKLKKEKEAEKELKKKEIERKKEFKAKLEERPAPKVEKKEKIEAKRPEKPKTEKTVKPREEKQKVEPVEKIEKKEEKPKKKIEKVERPKPVEEKPKVEEKEGTREKLPEKEKIKLSKEEKAELEALKKLMGAQPKKKKKKKKKEKEEARKPEAEKKEEEELKIAIIPEVITVRELADLLNLPVNQIMADLLQKGILATVNQTIDPEIALQIAEEHGFLAEIQKEGEEVSIVEELPEEEKAKILEEEEEEGELVERPPVVTVMGHVDHGKTTLLDTIRKTDVAAREKGGITQHIGAYKIKLPNGKEITFLDTPGHEAFTTLRARGSKVADIAVLVVAADDGVKPQTVEAINHAKNAGVPIIVAINKIDKPGADPERVKRELSQYGLIPEEWGGDTIMVPVSAKTGQNVEELLENILLVAEILDLKANPNKPAVGTVIESKLDPKKGAVATILIENGTLHQGDYFVAGYTWGKVRAMFDERGNQLKEAGPGTPVEILGFNEVPQAGDKFIVKKTEREARQLAELRKRKREEELLAKKARLHFENLAGQKEINIIVKADVQGSLEAIIKSLEELSEKFEDVSINVIHSGIGGITESDVMLAAASNAIILGFNVRPDAAARKAAEEENVDIRIYSIIYDLVEDMEKALKGMLEPVEREQFLGTCEVKQIFRIKGVGTVAGCLVTEGVIRRNAKARLVRDGVVIYDGEIASLKRFKEDVKEVAKGYECGVMLKDFNDVKPGDIIESYEIVQERQE
ncbi:translation initiation factor IF-2 [Persephonella hydrogeniphila]|uniref:Translation initiation factor IF-2 n=1 Tax=Persephonella hydrogeniphila TaxID=198703 RepID=A0A285NJ54_9AQUI|nr:translation initiation factor IF-2 [Persephonella hydrogeniphila]SNZ09520.1 translation initiation factor IF-2 [Persephonella hydrogeniphila]